MSSILDMAQNIVRNESSEFVICGLSMGGYVAQMVAHLAPEKVIAMGLLSTSGRADTEEKKKQNGKAFLRAPLATAATQRFAL